MEGLAALENKLVKADAVFKGKPRKVGSRPVKKMEKLEMQREQVVGILEAGSKRCVNSHSSCCRLRLSKVRGWFVSCVYIRWYGGVLLLSVLYCVFFLKEAEEPCSRNNHVLLSHSTYAFGRKLSSYFSACGLCARCEGREGQHYLERRLVGGGP